MLKPTLVRSSSVDSVKNDGSAKRPVNVWLINLAATSLVINALLALSLVAMPLGRVLPLPRTSLTANATFHPMPPPPHPPSRGSLPPLPPPELSVREAAPLPPLAASPFASGPMVNTRSCGRFFGQLSTDQSVFIGYHWQRSPGKQTSFSIAHQKDWAQNNHICPFSQTTLITQLTLAVDTAVACSCRAVALPADPMACEDLHSVEKRRGWDGMTSTTRLFIGDSRMSGEARVYAQTLWDRCKTSGGEFRRSTNYSDPNEQKKADFAVWCKPINAWALYLRDNRLELGWQGVRRKIRDLLVDDEAFSDAVTAPWKGDSDILMSVLAAPIDTSNTHVEVIFGAYVWDIIGRDGWNVTAFMHESIDESPLARFYAELRSAMPNASYVLRGAPPVNPPVPSAKLEGPLNGKLALIRDTHVSWASQEQAFATRHGIDFLNSFKLIEEYVAVLGAVLAPEIVGLNTLYKDTWHPCVPEVPATYVSLLPLMAIMRLRNAAPEFT